MQTKLLPKITVCMATYNGEQFIQKQLESILPQLGNDDEIVISDDLSSDRTVDIIRQFNDNRIRILAGNKFGSAMLNFENTIKNASGDYIILADQDDVWMPDKLNVTINLLKKYDLVLSDCQVVNSKYEVMHESFFRLRNSKPGFWRNLYKNPYIGCCMAFRKDVLNYALPFPKQIHMHDWWIGLLVELKGQVYFYPSPLIQYVRHGNNASPTADGKGYGPVKRLQNRVNMLYSVFMRWLK